MIKEIIQYVFKITRYNEVCTAIIMKQFLLSVNFLCYSTV